MPDYFVFMWYHFIVNNVNLKQIAMLVRPSWYLPNTLMGNT